MTRPAAYIRNNGCKRGHPQSHHVSYGKALKMFQILSAVTSSARFGVRARLLLSFLSITTFAVLGAIAAVYALVKISESFELITKERVPVALIAQELSREAERLVAIGPAMLSSTTLEEQEQRSEEM